MMTYSLCTAFDASDTGMGIPQSWSCNPASLEASTVAGNLRTDFICTITPTGEVYFDAHDGMFITADGQRIITND